MAFDFNNSSGSGGHSAFDDGPSVPKRSSGSRSGFHIPQSESSAGRNRFDSQETTRERMGRELQTTRTRELDRRGSRSRSRGISGVDIPWTLIIYLLIAVVVVTLLVVFWDVIYALMVNILTFLLLLAILLAVLRFLLRR